jgi:hypothetical protein
MRHVSENA